jgi:putative ABC transport system permease protein
MAIGVAAVVVLTALGDGARRYVMREFTALGSNLVIVLPGRTATGGIRAEAYQHCKEMTEPKSICPP